MGKESTTGSRVTVLDPDVDYFLITACPKVLNSSYIQQGTNNKFLYHLRTKKSSFFFFFFKLYIVTL